MNASVPQERGTEGGPEHQTEVMEVAKVLAEFEDLLLIELSKELPPRREVDDRIELIPGAAPPGRPPYRMASMELAELQHQLDELLMAGFIRPLVSPFGALVLF